MDLNPSYKGPIVDAHFHNFGPGWPKELEFTMKDFAHITKDLNVVGSCHIQTTDDLAETKWLDEQAKDNPQGPQAILFGGVLQNGAGEFKSQIEEHTSASALVRGIRQSLSHHKDFPDCFNKINELSKDPKFREAFALLEANNMSYEAWCFGHQIPEVADLAKAFPNVPIVLDHFGTPFGLDTNQSLTNTIEIFGESRTSSPEEQRRIFDQWKVDFAELAKCPNVHAKLSGLTMPFCLAARKYIDARQDKDVVPVKALMSVVENKDNTYPLKDLVAAHLPYVAHAISHFGVDRVFWSSNFPPDGFSRISYADNWRSYAICLDLLNISEADQRKIFFENAQKFYRISVDEKLKMRN